MHIAEKLHFDDFIERLFAQATGNRRYVQSSIESNDAHALKIPFATSKTVSECLHARSGLFCSPVETCDNVHNIARNITARL